MVGTSLLNTEPLGNSNLYESLTRTPIMSDVRPGLSAALKEALEIAFSEDKTGGSGGGGGVTTEGESGFLQVAKTNRSNTDKRKVCISSFVLRPNIKNLSLLPVIFLKVKDWRSIVCNYSTYVYSRLFNTSLNFPCKLF